MKKEQLKKGSHKKVHPNAVHKPGKQLQTNRYYDLLGLAVMILLGIIIYSNSFNCSFHFDDLGDIFYNTRIRNLSEIKAWWNYVPSRPLGNLTFALNYHFNQLDVRYYHLVNLVIHLINACLVWWLTLLIFSSPVLKDHPVARQKNVIAFFTALLFVSHPLATQSVTYIVQRLASMVAMFYLLSLALYVKARLSNKSNTSKYLLFAGSFLSAVSAMLTKENAFTLPFAIVLAELFFLRTKKLTINFRNYRVILLIAAFLGLIIIIPLKFSFSIFKPIPPTQGHAYTITSLNYLLTEFSVIVKYIQLLFLPINQRLDYDFPISNNFFEIRTLLSFLLLSALVMLAIFLFKKYRIISFGIFWFFLTLSIESSIIPIPNVIFEHRTYLPSVGFFLILSSGIYILLWNKYKYLAIFILVIIIGSNSYLTYERNKVWKDDFSIWNDNIAKAPNLARPFNNRGAIYQTRGQWNKAIADFSRAIMINPNFADAYSNLGSTYGNIGQWDKDTAYCSRAIELNPTFTYAYFNRGIAYDNFGMWDKSIADYSRVIMLDPNYVKAYSNRGVAYGHLGQWDKAIADFSGAIGIDPNFAEAYSNLGVVYGNIGQWAKAIPEYTKAIAIDPNFAKAYYNRGIAYGNLQQWDTAITDYTRAIGIDPNYKEAYFKRGIACMNLGQYDKAIADFSRTVEIDPNYTQAYYNRNIAYAKLGSGKR